MKIFPAELKGDLVVVDGGVVAGCPVLGEGGNSEGYFLMSEDKILYLPKTTPDLKNTLEIISRAFAIIASGIYPRNNGGDITSANFQTEIANLKVEIEKLMGELK